MPPRTKIQKFVERYGWYGWRIAMESRDQETRETCYGELAEALNEVADTMPVPPIPVKDHGKATE